MTEAAPGPELTRFPIQLADVYCVRSVAERRPRGAETSEHPVGIDINVSLMPGDLSEDRRVFGCRVRIVANYAVLANEVVACDIVVQGVFASEAAIEPEAHLAFVEYTPLVLLWPFARAYMSEVGRMLGVSIPMLPTLDAVNSSAGRVDADVSEPSTG